MNSLCRYFRHCSRQSAHSSSTPSFW